MPAAPPGPLWVLGTGAIGAFVGGALQAAGADTHFIVRPRVRDALQAHGLHLTDLDGGERRLSPGQLQLHDRLPDLLHPATAAGRAPALVLLAVKSGDTAAAAATLAGALPAGTPVLSLQNGLSNAALAQAQAPTLRIIPGMVPFNVAELGPGHWHRGTAGGLAAQDDPALRAWLPRFAAAGLPLDLRPDLRPVQWGKLLLNLNNPVNALSGLPLRAQLLERGYRRVLAALQDEALQLLAQAGITPAQVAAVPPRRMPALLRLPTPLFRLVAARSLRIDAHARSSMADDLARGRATEIDALAGEVLKLAASLGRQAPANAAIVELVKAWPQRQRPWPADELLAALGLR